MHSIIQTVIVLHRNLVPTIGFPIGLISVQLLSKMKTTTCLIVFAGLVFCRFNLPAADIQWSELREGVRIGVQWEKEHFPGNGIAMIYVSPTTNYSKNLVVPEPNQEFEYVLKDLNGNLMKLTKEGEKYGVQLQTSMSRSRKISRQVRFPGDERIQLTGCYIDRIFELKQSGEYELEIRVRLLKEDGKKLIPIIFNPIKIKVMLSSNSSS